MLEKVYHYHWLAFVSKEKCIGKIVYYWPTYTGRSMCVCLKYILNIKGIC